jgi:hypothetical protein
MRSLIFAAVFHSLLDLPAGRPVLRIFLPQVLIFCEQLVAACSFFAVQFWSRSGRCRLGFWPAWSLASPVLRARFDLESSVYSVPFPISAQTATAQGQRPDSPLFLVMASVKLADTQERFVIFLSCFESVPALLSTVTTDMTSKFVSLIIVS